jgi:hypothetical protein
MNTAQERFAKCHQQRIQETCNQLLDITLDRLNYPKFDPDRADQLTRELLQTGRLAIAPEGMKGLCV